MSIWVGVWNSWPQGDWSLPKGHLKIVKSFASKVLLAFLTGSTCLEGQHLRLDASRGRVLLFFYGLWRLIKHDLVVFLKPLKLSSAQFATLIAVTELMIVASDMIDAGYVIQALSLVSLAIVPAGEGVFWAVYWSELVRGAVALIASGYLVAQTRLIALASQVNALALDYTVYAVRLGDSLLVDYDHWFAYVLLAHHFTWTVSASVRLWRVSCSPIPRQRSV